MGNDERIVDTNCSMLDSSYDYYNNSNFMSSSSIFALSESSSSSSDIIDEMHTPEYIRKREDKQMQFWSAFKTSNIFYNLYRITSLVYRRKARTILLYLLILNNMFWNAIIVSGNTTPFNQPDEEVKIYGIRSSKVWIAFVSPLFSSVMLYLYAGLLKASDIRIFNAKTNQAFRIAMHEIEKEVKLRMFMSSLLGACSTASMIWYISRFSALYGYEYNLDGK